MKKEKLDKEKLDIKDIKKQLEECQKTRDEYLNGWKRARADFLNYKKEEAERVKELIKYANEKFILKLLPILDNIEIAEKKIPKGFKGDPWVEGVLKIKIQILDFLKNQGVKEITCLGEKFNPNFHEVALEAKKPGTEPGIIIEEIKKGYLLNGKVLRPAKVKVSK